MSTNGEETCAQTEDGAKNGEWIDSRFIQEVLCPESAILRIDVEAATGKGDNFMGALHRCRVRYRTPDAAEERVGNFIVKEPPVAEEMLDEFMRETEVFERELSVYKILPRMYAFADSRLKDEPFKKFSADFYPCSRPDTLVLSDLKSERFVMQSRRDRLDLNHCTMVLKYLARFHALSVAYAQENSNYFSRFPEIFFVERNDKMLRKFNDPLFKAISKVIKKWEGFEGIAEKVGSRCKFLMHKMYESCKPENSLINVLIHGDCWINNLMFKYSESGDPIDLRFIDFQLTRKSSPAFDLHYFFISSPQTHVRQNHYNDLLREYCGEFAITAKKLGFKGTIFSFEDIIRELKRTEIFAFLSSLGVMAVTLVDPNESPAFNKMTQDNLNADQSDDAFKMFDNPKYQEEMKSLLPGFDKRGVFD